MKSASILELETALKKAEQREEAALEVGRELQAHNIHLKQRIGWLEARIKDLENPKGRRSEDHSWVDKIALIIARMERPMRSREIMRELQDMDRDYAIEALANPEKSLSVALSRAVESGRLKQFKQPGTRGAYYALPKWVDKNGNLSKAMRDEIF